MCSGQHSVFILLAKLGGWELETYWQDDHPAQAAVREAVGAAFAVDPARIRDRRRRLRDPHLRVPPARGRPGVRDPRRPGGRARRRPTDRDRARTCSTVRDAMLAYPELVAGTRDRLDTSLMKAVDGRVREQERRRGPARRRDPAAAPRGDGVRAGLRRRAQDRGRRRGDAWRRGPRPSRPCARSGVARGPGAAGARPLPPAAVLDPHGRRSRPRRSRSSSSRRSAS